MDSKTLILQILNNDSTLTLVSQEEITVMELLFKGGFMMIPILFLFVTIRIFRVSSIINYSD